MNYQPTKNTEKASITKKSVIGKSKWADRIGYWIYLFIRFFKKPTPEPTPHFLLLCSKIPLPQKRYYWNKKGVECVDFDCHGFNLIVGLSQGYTLLRLHDKKQAIDKSLRFNPTKSGIQEVLGVINSMQISLKDKINKS